MASIGNSPTQQAFTPAIDYFSGNGSTTAFTLSRPVASVAQVQVTIDNVAQNPSSAYTVSSNTITFTSAPLSGTNNIYVYYTSPITQVIAPGQGTVTSDSFGTITNFTTTGNTVLGDATTDTLTVGVTGIVKDSSGNVGIGTASPTALTSNKALTINSPTGFGSLLDLKTNETLNLRVFSNASNSGLSVKTATPLLFDTNDTERMRIDSSGNVLIATTNAITGITGVQLTASNTSENPAYINIFRDDTTIGSGQFLGYLQFCGRDATSSLGTGHAYVAAVAEADHGAGDNATAITFGTTPDNSSTMAERMRIDSSGSLLINGTTQPVNTYKQVITFSGGGGAGGGLLFNDGDSGNTYPAVYFRKDGAQRGNINVSTSGTTYNTVSDYRLKEDVVPMVGALAKVSALKPVTYKWKSNGLDGQGFIAHELQAVIPDCVTGEKDGVETYTDENGNEQTRPKHQGVDTSFLVATLTAAIQELKTIVDAQAAEIAELKAKVA